VSVALFDADARARELISTDLQRTLFVEAGAGAGKTRELVNRVVSLVESGVPISSIAAITFTDKAAGELRDRVRAGLEALGTPRCRQALELLDEAHIQTLHAFAQSVVAAHAVAAGLPPVFEVSDEIEAAIDFDRRFDPFIDDLLTKPEYEQMMTVAWTLGLRGERLRDLARQFHEHWDQVAAVELPSATVEAPDLSPLADLLDRTLAARAGCLAPGDRLLAHLDTDVAAVRQELRYADGPVGAARFFNALGRLAAGNKGTRTSWRSPSKDEVLALLVEADALAEDLRQQLAVPVLVELCRLVREFTLHGVAERTSGGRLEFHDLLVVARNLVRDHPDVRAAVRAEVTHLLIDEFQDTDPLQVELALLLATGPLFFVGDPKQSIYRFRRADIALYHRVRDQFAADRVELAHNFRSVSELLEWLNAVFSRLLGEDSPGQAPWAPLVHRRGAGGAGPPVALLGGPAEAGLSLAAVREREAADVADACRLAVQQPWLIGDDVGSTRPAQFDDVAILVPTRATLAALERALDAAGVPYRVESRSLLWATQEVRDLLSVLRAIDDPSDEVAVVAALRSPLLACHDRDLVEWRAAGGRWTPRADATAVHPVAEALAWLARMHEERWQEAVSATVERVVDERRAFELAFGRRRQRESWHRVRFLVDQARAFCDRGGASLRSFVDWAERQADEGAAAVETVVPESDDRAVRILTVHAAKGLEFPIVIVSGLNTIPRRWRPAEVLWSPDGLPLVSVGRRDRPWHTPGYEDVREGEIALEQQEALRLLYVACTRARDHLVISLHHKPEALGPGACLAARLLPDALAAESAGLSRRLEPAGDAPVAAHAQQLPLADATDPTQWQQRRDQLLSRQSGDRVLAATALSDHLSPTGPAGGGAAFGRAVHAVLQSVDLATGSGLDALATVQAAAEGLAGQAVPVGAAARAVLATPIVAEATSRRFWREVYVAADIDGCLIEGYIDLLVDAADGLVVVDYKTDVVADPAPHRLQLAAYALALEHNLGVPVARAELVFTSPAGARQWRIEDLPEAKAEVRRVLAEA
jgi:ATP-dependent helicase/nuclease subunit A